MSAAASERTLLDALIAKLTQQANNIDSLKQEFYSLPDDGIELGEHSPGPYTTNFGNKPENKKKNRYKDIVPYDYTRVELSTSFGADSDYVNANYVKGPTGKSSYIACQGPLKHTVADMWRMVWECDVQAIIMACNEKEGERIKCERYWPTTPEEPLKVDDVFLIRLISEKSEPQDNYITRRMRVTLLQQYSDAAGNDSSTDSGSQVNENGQAERVVTQYHYVGWPDYGTPSSNVHLIQLLTEIREAHPRVDIPIVVHCSAGCGRTGTVMCVDYVANVIRLNLLTTELSVKDVILEMRRQRVAVVQSFDQYVMCHQCVLDLLKRRLAEINGEPSNTGLSQSSGSTRRNQGGQNSHSHNHSHNQISAQNNQNTPSHGHNHLGRQNKGSEKLHLKAAELPELRTNRDCVSLSLSNSSALDPSPAHSPFVQVHSLKSRPLGSTSTSPSPSPSSPFTYPSHPLQSATPPKHKNRTESSAVKSLSTPSKPHEDGNNNKQPDTPVFGSDVSLSKRSGSGRLKDLSAPSTPNRHSSKSYSRLGFGKKSPASEAASPSPSPSASPSLSPSATQHSNGHNDNKGDESRATRVCHFVFRGIDVGFRKLVGAHPQGARDPPWTPPQT